MRRWIVVETFDRNRSWQLRISDINVVLCLNKAFTSMAIQSAAEQPFLLDSHRYVSVVFSYILTTFALRMTEHSAMYMIRQYSETKSVELG